MTDPVELHPGENFKVEIVFKWFGPEHIEGLMNEGTYVECAHDAGFEGDIPDTGWIILKRGCIIRFGEQVNVYALRHPVINNGIIVFAASVKES